MTALALFLLLCWFSVTVVTVVGCLRAFHDSPPSLNKDENLRRMTEAVEPWRQHLKALSSAQAIAGVLLALVVLLG